ncbi:BnaC07g03190D [Brassica napus]|uniref:(rape) hypothetical protein n=1 Tax=Brassica napus TaxID=3708 RepID=A0A078FF86_BRANA|nr:unnamed protein product [Brassica napus]CDY13020.1 BnaC07g03190D [Brassica napus]
MNLEATRQGSLSLMPQLQWQVYWERDEEAGGEGGASMSELRCGKDDAAGICLRSSPF